MSKMKLPLNLAPKRVEFGETTVAPMVEDSYGPSVHFDWDEDYGFPDAGTMTVKFRVKHRSEDIDKKGEKKFHVCLELVELQKVKEEKSSSPANSYDEAGKAMDKLRAEMESENEE